MSGKGEPPVDGYADTETPRLQRSLDRQMLARYLAIGYRVRARGTIMNFSGNRHRRRCFGD